MTHLNGLLIFLDLKSNKKFYIFLFLTMVKKQNTQVKL